MHNFYAYQLRVSGDSNDVWNKQFGDVASFIQYLVLITQYDTINTEHKENLLDII